MSQVQCVQPFGLVFDDSLYEGPVPETFSFDVRSIADNIGGISIVHIVDDEGGFVVFFYTKQYVILILFFISCSPGSARRVVHSG